MSASTRFESVKVGDALPERVFTADTIQLFLYNAILWNPHKIHFDKDYATTAEGYRERVMAGPQQGDWLTQAAVEWVGDAGRLVSIEYSNRRAGYIGDTLRSTGSVKAIDAAKREVTLELAIRNQDDEVLTPGTAVVRFAAA